MNTQLLFGVAVVPAVIGLVEVCKDLGLPTRAAPAAAVVFGVLAAMAQLYAGTWPWIQAVVLGISLGLSACGLYSGAKTIVQKVSTDQSVGARPLPSPLPETPTTTAVSLKEAAPTDGRT